MLPKQLKVGLCEANVVRKGRAERPIDGEALVIAVEGFLLFTDAKSCSMLDATFWIDAACETCLHRRHQRECKNSDIETFSKWYRDSVWKHYELYKGQQLANVPKLKHLDGSAAVEELVAASVAFLNEHVKGKIYL